MLKIFMTKVNVCANCGAPRAAALGETECHFCESDQIEGSAWVPKLVAPLAPKGILIVDASDWLLDRLTVSATAAKNAELLTVVDDEQRRRQDLGDLFVFYTGAADPGIQRLGNEINRHLLKR